MLRQVEFSLFDIRIHHELEGAIKWSEEKIVFEMSQLLEKIRGEIALIKPPSFQRFPQSFSHIFAGGYSAGYYSYKWAEVLSADCYSMFENKPDEQQSKLGKQFLEEILSKGGSRPALKSFRKFMNREPSTDALLRHSGL
jgi:oligopeptidase A